MKDKIKIKMSDIFLDDFENAVKWDDPQKVKEVLKTLRRKKK